MGDYVLEDEYDSVGSSSSSDLGNECETQRKSHQILSSPETSLLGDSNSRSPLLLAVITDGNATDDSGIDSICCDNAVSPSSEFRTKHFGIKTVVVVKYCIAGELPDQAGLGTLNELVEEETAVSESDHGSNNRDATHYDKAEMRQKSPGHKSFLYDTYAGARTLSRPKLESSVWKKELVISGYGNGLSGGRKSLHSSREDLCESGGSDSVELRSVKFRCEDTLDTIEDRGDLNISALYSSVIKSDKKKPVLEISPDNNKAGPGKNCANNDNCESHHKSGLRETYLPTAGVASCHDDHTGSTVVSKVRK